MNYKKLLDTIIKKQCVNVEKIGVQFPYNDVSGKFETVEKHAWTNGYWPGLLWLCYKWSGEEVFKETAVALEEELDSIIASFDLPAHDVGFVWLLSSGIHNALEKNPESKRRLLQMANYLSGRFNIKSNTIRAWECEDGDKTIPTLVIIDCMMNIPLLFVASETIGDPRYAHIAKAHADTVLAHFIDEDGAVRHICRFDTESGEYIEALGGQGYSSKSSWARGAAWAIYGFAMAYRYTKNEKYLAASKKVAKFFVSQIQTDYVPAWDFRAPNNNIKDTSAGAIAASGMLLLYAQCKDEYYKNEAEKIIGSIYEKCWIGDKCEAMLGKATANLPGDENIEVGLIYGDYYFTEAVYKLAKEEYSLPWEEK